MMKMCFKLFFACFCAAVVCLSQENINNEDYTDIPVATAEIKIPVVNVPVVNVPIVKIGTTNEMYMKCEKIDSYPFSYYVSNAVSRNELDDNFSTLNGNVLPSGFDNSTIVVRDVEGANVYVADLRLMTINDYSYFNLTNNLIASTSEIQNLTINVEKLKDLAVKINGEVVTIIDVKSGNVVATSVVPVDAPIASVTTTNVPMASIQVQNIAVPSVYSPQERIEKWANLLVKVKNLFKDKRMLQYDNGIDPFKESFVEWVKIYEAHKQYVMKHIPLQDNIKMIAEARVPTSEEELSILNKNLDFYSGQGYNSVLLGITTSETNAQLLEVVNCVKNHKMKLWFALSGRETLVGTLFVSPMEIKRCFDVVAPYAQGMLVGWRRTSVHLFDMDLEYANYLVETARNANENLLVLGEGYYGQTASSNERTNKLTYNMPPNVSGCLLVGVGYSSVNASMAVNVLFNAVKSMPCVAVVLGDRPYYATRNNNGKSFAQNLAIKQSIERKFVSAGCIGTITLHSDGSDGIYDKSVTDNLSAW